MNLTFRVKQQTITKDITDEVPRIGSREYLYLVFTFSTDWSNLNKTLYISDGTYSDAINITELIPVQVPSYYTQNASFTITLMGTHENTVVPTNVVTCILEQSNEVWEAVAPNPDSITYQQLIEALSKIESVDDAVLLAQKYAEDSANSAKQAEEVLNTANNAFANALKGKESDKAFLIDDVSPLTRELRVKVRGKNLIPYPYPLGHTVDMGGVTFTANRDGTITANGTAQDDIVCSVFTPMAYFTLQKGQTYTVSDLSLPTDSSSTTYYLKFDYVDTDSTFATLSGDKKYSTFTAEQEKIMFHIVVKTGVTVENVVFKPQIELGTVATDFEPYVPSLTSVKVLQYGKNLARFLDGYDTSGASVTGTILKPQKGYYCALAKVLPGQSYSISKETNTSGRFRVFYYKNSPLDNPSEESIGGRYNDNAVSSTIKKVPEGANYLLVAIGNVLENVQIEVGKTVTEYEPYIPAIEHTPTEDGTVNGVTSIYENTTLMADRDGVIIDCEYNRDINKAFAALEAAIATNNS